MPIKQYRTNLVAGLLAVVALSQGACSSKDSGNKGQNSANTGGQDGVCTQGMTRECLGPGACKGAQSCQADLIWTACDCGSGTGGSSSAGTTASDTGGATNASASGGTGNATGGVANTDVGGSSPSSTGGQANDTGGAATGSGGSSATATGGAPTSLGGGSTLSTGGAPTTGGTSGAGAATGGGTSSPYIIETNGWAVDPAHAVSGPLYTFVDSGGTYIYPDCSSSGTCFKNTGPTSQFCASGTAAKAVDASGLDCRLTSSTCDWSTYWGAAVAINPNQAASSTTPSAWDASAYTGIAFAITVSAMPANLRLYVNLVGGAQYCYPITTSKTYTVNWGALVTNCYDSTLVHTPLSGAALKQIQSIAWQVGTNASQSMAFDFCVNNLQVN